MKNAVDGLMQKYHGEKDMLKLVDQDYADMVHRSATNPNSLLHPTTRLHISRYVKHLAKLLNIISSLNTSQETLLLTQHLWHSLTEGSETATVPVVTMGLATVNPPAPVLSTPLSQESIENIVEGILEQQPQQHQQKSRQTDLSCLWTAQVSKSLRLMDPPSTSSTTKGLCAISIALKGCIKVMLMRDSQTPKCPCTYRVLPEGAGGDQEMGGG